MTSSFFLATVLAVISAVALGQTPSPSPACQIKHVCYILDQSGSINDNEYALEQRFVNKIADIIDSTSITDPFNSAVAFSRSVRTIQPATNNLHTFKDAVSKERIFRSTTRISFGLRQCQRILEGKQGSRTMVLLTDGEPDSSDRLQTINAAEDITNAGIGIVAVGIGNSVNADLLRQLVPEPEFYIDTRFDDLDSKIQVVANAICNIIPEKTECEKAYDKCLFKFSGVNGFNNAIFSIAGEPDKSFTPRVVPKATTYSLGTLNTNNVVPEFIEGNQGRPITEFGSQRFTPTHFKPYWISEERGSGVGHQTFQGNQLEVANDKCVRVYFTSFQEVPPNGQVVNRNNVPTSENKCVVFRTKLQ
ncbi:hypothetical protein BWQ96_05328 [Gracilariopsis chorda]|uniref:VWFA domain-containing protein n=1 Tax=Gracilariopsis chorda TaxID=448386 RepID=A0A2V3IQI6_9FLOR|nr:hypothetical protein BWQ96_06856 [Gracilariopsis chorda]PXF44908.1 hypothetical protein BWQ96_05328 [Gracilariopsis chorda]|eukprot:PXF43410.1 hypothetical protein BWQ96_06856 [Gracilariopsis chorda]